MKSVRKISLLAIAALVLIAFAACQGRGQGSSGKGTARSWPGPAPQDLGGVVFKIADFYGNRFAPLPEDLGTAEGDLKAMIIKSIEDDFNVKFQVMHYGADETFYRLRPAVMSGDLFAHMIVGTQWSYGQFIGSGLLGDLKKVPALNLDNGIWMKSVHNATTINGEVFATAGIVDLWQTTVAMFFQKSLWNELNLPDPYELVRRGEWTWDKLLEFAIIAAADMTGDGVISGPNDRWGMLGAGDDLLRAWYTSMGGLYYDVDPATGRLYSPAATPDGIAIANWMRAFTEVPGAWYGEHGQTDDTRNEMFVNRRALFSVGFIEPPEAFRQMHDDFGILPMPKRNVQQKTYLNNVNHNAALIAITRTNNQLEETGIIMEALAARFADVRALQQSDLRNVMLRSEEDEEMLDYIIPYTVFDMSHILFRAGNGFEIPHARLTDYVTMHAIGDFASAIEAEREAMELGVNEFMGIKR